MHNYGAAPVLSRHELMPQAPGLELAVPRIASQITYIASDSQKRLEPAAQDS